MELTERDVAILFDVYKYRYLAYSQLMRLHFTSIKPAYRRIHKLTKEGFIKSFHVPSIPEYIFYLDKKGAEIVAGATQTTVDNLQWYRYTRAPKDYHFLKHFLAINDFRIVVTQACVDSPVQLLGFIPEYVGEKTLKGNVKKYIRDRVCDITNQAIQYSHTPDGVFVLEKEERPALFFVEVDRGGETVSDPERGLLKSLVFYLHYLVGKNYQRYEQDFRKSFKSFRALLITPSKERLQHVREAVSRLPFNPPHAKRYLWGTTTDQVSPHTLFDAIWVSLDVTDTKLYQIG